MKHPDIYVLEGQQLARVLALGILYDDPWHIGRERMEREGLNFFVEMKHHRVMGTLADVRIIVGVGRPVPKPELVTVGTLLYRRVRGFFKRLANR